MFYACFDGDLEYVAEVISSDEYKQRFGHLDDMFQPRCKSFASREEAEAYMVLHNKEAQYYYAS